MFPRTDLEHDVESGEVRVVEQITRNGHTWVLAIDTEGMWRAYPDREITISTGEIYAYGATRERVLRSAMI